jgi:hypothetical protein
MSRPFALKFGNSSNFVARQSKLETDVAETFGIKERSALIALMAEAREVSNAELKKRIGFPLDGASRRKLNDLRLVASHKQKNGFVHELTDQGWAWCAKELSSERPERCGSAGGALYAVLAGLRRYLERKDIKLSDVFGAVGAEQSNDIEDKIRRAYLSLARERGAWVSLTKLRPLLGAGSRVEIDAALQRMNREATAHLVPDSNQKTLTNEDREAAVRIGGELKHLISMDVR